MNNISVLIYSHNAVKQTMETINVAVIFIENVIYSFI